MKRSTPSLKVMAAHLIKWREDLGMTAEDIAEKSGIGMEYIERVEKGRGRAPEVFAYLGFLMKKTPEEEANKRFEDMSHNVSEISTKRKSK